MTPFILFLCFDMRIERPCFYSYIFYPLFVAYVPFEREFKRLCKSLCWFPSQFGFYFCGINRVAAIVPRTIGYEFDIRAGPSEFLENLGSNIEIAHFLIGADVICLSRNSFYIGRAS